MQAVKTWMVAAAFAAAFLCLCAVLDGPSEAEMAKATAASLRDALAQAQAERPELWTAEQKARASIAAELVAGEVQP